ncbi:unnamed protein product [Ascophyllum nodosum]
MQEMYPNCRILPTSKLEPNRTGIDNGDIRQINAMVSGVWYEDPDFNSAESTGYFSQTVGVSFIDIGAGAETLQGGTLDVYLPYSRITLTANTTFSTIESHLILTLTEFTGISKRGKKKATQKTFLQRTTSVESHFFWSGDTYEGIEVAFLLFTLHIIKFESSNIEEVDPMDAWTIIGTIGGVWQFVVIAFGLFFVFAEKQAPEFKLRNFRKTATKPISIAHRLSTISSRNSSTQGVAVQAGDEDLPAEWVERQRPNGSMYYHNTSTGLVTDGSPHGLNLTLELPAPSAGSQAANQAKAGGDPLPAGWVERTDKNGRKFYMNTLEKYTQWERPTQLPAPPFGSRGDVREVDVPRMSTQRSYASGDGNSGVDPSDSQRHASRQLWPRAPNRPHKTSSADQGAAVAVKAELPENWKMGETADGRQYYVNHVTKQTQWQRPIG